MGCEIACNRGITKFVWRIDTLWVITSQGKSLLSLARVVGWASEYQRTFDDLARQGYRLTWVNGYESSGIEKFASIWEKRPGPPWVARRGLTGDELQLLQTPLRQQGYRLIRISGYESGGIVKYATIWEKRPGPAWTARWGLDRLQYSQTFETLRQQSYRPIDISGYQAAGSAHYAAIFQEWSGDHWWA